MLRDCGQDVNGEAIGFREVASDKVNSRFHEGANEVNIPRETIQLGNYQRRLMQAAEPESLGNRRTIISLPALHFHDLLDKLPFPAVQITRDGLPLSFQP